MIELRRGRISKILARRAGLVELEVEEDGSFRRAAAYEALTGPVEEGQEVILNTTATALNLGSGGYDFVLHVLGNDRRELTGVGHIMKLRYTPLQVRCLSVEEEASPHRRALEQCQSLEGMPVIAGSVHSMLAPAALAVRHLAPRARVAYVMTDGGALPLTWSRTVEELRAKGYLDATITVGHAFGGELEAVNKFSGLLAARAAARADVAIVAMGPGIVGTGTRYGHTGLEQGEVINAAAVLGGVPIAVPRLSFADPRERQRGVSHHTLTALGRVALARAIVSLPLLPPPERTLVQRQLAEAGVLQRHEVREVDTSFLAPLLDDLDFSVTYMGRSYRDDPFFFEAAAAAGAVAVQKMREVSGTGLPGEEEREQ